MNRVEALESALKLVTEDRNATYGEPWDQLTHVQLIKNAVGARDCPGLSLAEIEAIDSICVKLSRLCGPRPTMDSWLDIIGYGAIGAEARSLCTSSEIKVGSK